MLIPLSITIAVALGMLALIVGAYWLATRAAQGGGITVGSWRWFPSPLALLILLPIAVFLLWRFSGALLLIPFILPFIFRRGFGRQFFARMRRRDSEEDRPPPDDQ